MKEAAEKVIDYAINTLQLQKIEAFTHNDNQHSTKLLLKLGFNKSIEADKENPSTYTIYTLTNIISNRWSLIIFRIRSVMSNLGKSPLLLSKIIKLLRSGCLTNIV